MCLNIVINYKIEKINIHLANLSGIFPYIIIQETHPTCFLKN